MSLTSRTVCLVFIAISVTLLIAEKDDYEGSYVVRVTVDHESKTLVDDFLRDNAKSVTGWGRHWATVEGLRRLAAIDILVRQEASQALQALTTNDGIQSEVMIPDVEGLLREQHMERQERSRTARRHLLSADNYHRNLVGRYPRFQEVIDWLYRLAAEKPDLVRVVDIGASTENRQIRIIKISSSLRHGRNRPGIWIDAAVHAREWIGPATVIYMIDKLVHEYGRDVNVTRLVDQYDWYLLPIANPDGYEYSHVYNRLWRKTRSRHGNVVGVDLNRNFNFHWRNCSSHNNVEPIECSDNYDDVYAGPHPLSEPESAAMARFLLDHKDKFVFYFSLHAYAQFWLVPWAHSHVLPDDFLEMMALAEIGSQALKTDYGTTYICGPPAIILYQAGGTTMDWAKGVAKIKYPFILELRDRGKFGFLLPEREIIPTASETMTGISAVLEAYADISYRADMLDQSRGARRQATMQRYRSYLEKHLSFWGSVNRSYALDYSDMDYEGEAFTWGEDMSLLYPDSS